MRIAFDGSALRPNRTGVGSAHAFAVAERIAIRLALADINRPTIPWRALLWYTIGEDSVCARVIDQVACDEHVAERRVVGHLAMIKPKG